MNEKEVQECIDTLTSAAVSFLEVIDLDPQFKEMFDLVIQLCNRILALPTFELMEEAFKKERPLKIILEHLIRTKKYGDTYIEWEAIRNLRMVSKLWKNVVTGTFNDLNLDSPLLHLNLTTENSLKESAYVEKNGKALKKFNKIVASAYSGSSKELQPTFGLNCHENFFRKENLKDFIRCLVESGDSLMYLNMMLPRFSFMTFENLLQQQEEDLFTLRKLRELSVRFPKKNSLSLVPPLKKGNDQVDPSTGATTEQISIWEGKIISLIEIIFRAADNIKMFRLMEPIPGFSATVPNDFRNLNFPSTLTKFLLDCPVENVVLAIILTKDFPNVEEFHLTAAGNKEPYRPQLITRVLAKFALKLKILELRGTYKGSMNLGMDSRLEKSNIVEFPPKMEKLEVLKVKSYVWRVRAHHLNDKNNLRWDKQFPSLKDVALTGQMGKSLLEWNNSVEAASKVENLKISKFRPSFSSGGGADVPRSLNRNEMELVHRNFPNLTGLHIVICGENASGLVYIFSEMKTLRHLALSIKACKDYPHSIVWDELLTGWPPAIVKNLRYFRKGWQVWDQFDKLLKDNPNMCPPCIRNLPELRSISLTEVTLEETAPASAAHEVKLTPKKRRNPFEPSLISDVSWYFGFMKIPALRSVSFSGRFYPATTQITEKWEEGGRTFSYITDSALIKGYIK